MTKQMKIILCFLVAVILSDNSWAEPISPDDAVRILAAAKVEEDGGLSFAAGEWRKLDQWIEGRPLDALAELLRSPSASSLLERFILYAARDTTDNEFLEISITALRLYKEGKADRGALEAVLMPPNSKAGLLDVKFRDQRVQLLLKEVLEKLPPNDGYRDRVQNIISGEGARTVLQDTQDYFPKQYVSMANETLRDLRPKNASSNPDGSNHHSSNWNVKLLQVVVITLILLCILVVYLKLHMRRV